MREDFSTGVRGVVGRRCAAHGAPVQRAGVHVTLHVRPSTDPELLRRFDRWLQTLIAEHASETRT